MCGSDRVKRKVESPRREAHDPAALAGGIVAVGEGWLRELQASTGGKRLDHHSDPGVLSSDNMAEFMQ